MELVAQEHPLAREQLVRRLLSRVRRATRALLRDPADADDATQLCLIELLRSAASFRGEGSLEAWSDRIVVRTALRFARARTRRAVRLDIVDPETLPGASEERMREQIPRSTAEYLECLSAPRRTALVLRHVLGHSIEEIATITGVSPNTVKDRLLTARREFRRMIRRDRAIGPQTSRRIA